MGVKIVPHSEDLKDATERFNKRMREGGSEFGFYVDPIPGWVPKTSDDQPVWREYHIALGDDGEVVAGYCLKPQKWLIGGEEQIVSDWQGPFSLGAIDNRYAALGLRLLRDMLKKQPMIYSWGHGGSETPIIQMIGKMRWVCHDTPFLFRVARPRNFLRKNALLRKDPRKALAQDVLAHSGLGTVGMLALHKALELKALKRYDATATEFTHFGDWADDLWQEAGHRYDAIAFRDARSMNLLVPDDRSQEYAWPHPIKLRVYKGNRSIGWAVVLQRQQENDARFGDMNMGMIADYFSLPEDAGEVIHAAYSYLRDKGVDMVMANQAHHGWVAAFEDNGFIKVANRRIMATSPKLQAALQPFKQVQRGLFMSNLDGHGPMGI